LELATIEATGFQFVHTDAVQTHGGGGHPSGAALGCVVHRERGIVMKLKHRYPFSSTLKRMSTIVEHCALPSAASVAAGRPVAGQTSLFLFTKGAPEVLAEPGTEYAHLDVSNSFHSSMCN
jgi:magnesium-transporting ATPase (P-type)